MATTLLKVAGTFVWPLLLLPQAMTVPVRPKRESVIGIETRDPGRQRDDIGGTQWRTVRAMSLCPHAAMLPNANTASALARTAMELLATKR